MNSNRHQFQEVLESHLGCPDPSQLKLFKESFESLIVDENLSIKLTEALHQDCKSTYYKAIISIAEALCLINKGYESWSIVKLYYATFYLVRFAYAIQGFGIFRCGTLYTLSSLNNSKPVRRTGKGDHKVILNSFIKDYESTEVILSNKISGMHTFEWLMAKRETIHYRDASFSEPDLCHFEPSLSNGSMSTWLSIYLNSASLIYCFLANHACLAIPLCFCHRILETATSNGLSNLLNEEQQNTVLQLLGDARVSENADIKRLITQ